MPTLRLYEREGLIVPLRRASRHRLFTEGDIARLRDLRETINHKKISIAKIQHFLAHMPCWTINQCPESRRDACPHYAQTDDDLPCWLMHEKTAECTATGCRNCAVYNSITNFSLLQGMIEQDTAGNPSGHP